MATLVDVHPPHSDLGLDRPIDLVPETQSDMAGIQNSSAATAGEQTRSSEFADWIHSEGLIDLGFSGSKLMWVKGSQSGLVKGTRLDRALCNIEWRNSFPMATVSHLPRISSDHAPILIRMTARESTIRRAPFRFQAAWLTDSRLGEVVTGILSWKTMKKEVDGGLIFTRTSDDPWRNERWFLCW
nr:uncharacterized protein LOC109157440 [Ipomoea batatas]